MKMPDFFLVGAPKSGTTSIYNYLSGHPGVYVPNIKEPHYFACPEVKNTYYDVSFIESIENYSALFDKAEKHQKAGDFSPSYMYREKAARRIKKRCPNALILIIIRDPVERAISHYLMDKREGYVSVPLKECLEGEKKNKKKYYEEYVKVGMYYEQIKRFKILFGKNNVKVFLFRELKEDTESLVKNIEKFIGVEERVHSDLKKSHNKHVNFRNKFLKKIAESNFVEGIKKVVPEDAKRLLKKAVLSTEKPSMKEEKSIMQKIFKNEKRKIQDLIDKDVSHWS